MLRLKATQDKVGMMGIHASPKGYAGHGGTDGVCGSAFAVPDFGATSEMDGMDGMDLIQNGRELWTEDALV